MKQVMITTEVIKDEWTKSKGFLIAWKWKKLKKSKELKRWTIDENKYNTRVNYRMKKMITGTKINE